MALLSAAVSSATCSSTCPPPLLQPHLHDHHRVLKLKPKRRRGLRLNCAASDSGSSMSDDIHFRKPSQLSSSNTLGVVMNESSNGRSPYKWQRVLLKVSGEALAGDRHQNIDPKVTMAIAREVASGARHGVELQPGGNIFRGASWTGSSGLDRSSADYIGMLATVMNAIFLQATMESIGIPT